MAAPSATDDTYTLLEDGTLSTDATAGVLANDTDPEDDPLTAVLVSQPLHGILTFDADGSFTYTPDADFAGTDSFTYVANDGTADSEPATVTLEVTGENDAPVAADDAYTLAEDGTLSTSATTGVLANDTDAENDPLTASVVSGPIHGTLTFGADGSFTYTPDAGFTGTDDFTYVTNDGTTDSEPATVELAVLPRVVTFEAEDATLVGGVTVATTHDGFGGSGYADYGRTAGDTVEWVLDGLNSGSHTVAFRYANGSTAARPLDVYLDGERLETLDFAPTGGWDVWGEASLSSAVEIPFGETPTLALVMEGTNGPNVDAVTLSLTPDDTADLNDDLALTFAELRIDAEEAAALPFTIEGLDDDLVEATVTFADGTDEVVVDVGNQAQGGGDGTYVVDIGALSTGAIATRVDVRDDAGNVLAVDGPALIRAEDDLTSTPLEIAINFQPGGAPVPAGYGVDDGSAYEDGRGYGWVTEASLVDGVDGTVPFDATGEARDRDEAGFEQRFDTFVHMKRPLGTTTVATPLAWEYALPDGVYTVTVGVGDSRTSNLDSTHVVNVEGQSLLTSYTPDAFAPLQVATGTVAVVDGRLSLDSIGGENTKLAFVEIEQILFDRPAFTDSTIRDRAVGVDPTTSFTLGVTVEEPDDVIDEATAVTANARVVRLADGVAVEATVNTTGGNDSLSITPADPLAANTQYALVVDGVANEAGREFQTFVQTFTTGTEGAVGGSGELAFSRAIVATGASYTTLVIDPAGDHLYAATLTGQLIRWSIDPLTGDLADQEVLEAFPGRPIIGVAFDPLDPSTIWVTNNDSIFSQPATDFTGRLSRITLDPDDFTASTSEDYLVGLPRSARDHLSNSLAFGPDGLLYMTQGSNSAMGEADPAWNNRDERLLSAAVLQIDPRRDVSSGPIDVQTEAYEGTPGDYDPFAADAPVRLFGEGIRNAYDLVWHSNGELYVPTNGSAAGGYTPDDPNTPENEALTNVDVQNDYLFRVEEGGYYGHPNPLLGNYVLNGGNPTADVDPAEVVANPENGRSGYEVGVAPDPNWRGFAYDFGPKISANGVIEYRSNAFDGTVAGTLMVTEYSRNDLVRGLRLDENGEVVESFVVAEQFNNPLDLVEDPGTGRLYVIEFGAESDLADDQITLLKPLEGPSGLPVAVDDAYSVVEDGTLTVDAASGVLANDSDPENDLLRASVVSGPSNGTLDLGFDGGFTYTPAADFAGTDGFTYVADDGVNDSAPATVTLEVVGENDAPVAEDDAYTATSGATLTVGAASGVLANDSDPEDDPLTATLASGPSNGTLTLEADGGFSYTPDAGFTGTDGFTYVANDGSLDSVEATVSLDVTTTPPDRRYEAEAAELTGGVQIASNHDGFSGTGFADYGRTAGDTVTFTVEAAVAGDYELVLGYANGSSSNRPLDVVLDGNTAGVVDFAATGSWSSWVETALSAPLSLSAGTHTVTLVQTTSQGPNLDYAELRSFSDPNDAPVAEDDAYTATSGATLTVGAASGVLANDSDPEDDPLTATLASGPSNGTLTLEADGGFSYTPDAGFTGTDGFTYVANDGSLDSVEATVSLDVTTTPPDRRYEAEAAELTGGVQIASNHDGFSGTGFADYGRTAGDAVGWTIDVPVDGWYTLDFGYANGSSGERPLDLELDDQIQRLSFAPTGGWNSWVEQTLASPVYLTAGQRTVDLVMPGGNGPNVDYLDVAAYDFVTPAAVTGSEIELVNLDELPAPDRLIFNIYGSAGLPGTTPKDTATLRIANTGDVELEIGELLVDGPWEIVGFDPEADTIAPIAPGDFQDVELRFVATGGAVHEGSLTLTSSDPDEAVSTIELAGFWQPEPEGGVEPELREMMEVFGYQIDVPTWDEFKNIGPAATASSPDEVVSAVWQQADPDRPITVEQLAAFHTQGGAAGFRIIELTSDYDTQSLSDNNLLFFQHEGDDAQAFVPRLNNQDVRATGAVDAPDTPFVFAVSLYWSDPEKNENNRYLLRFFEFTDKNGETQPDKWLMTMDYNSTNDDFQDNVYLIDNITPLGMDTDGFIV